MKKKGKVRKKQKRWRKEEEEKNTNERLSKTNNHYR